MRRWLLEPHVRRWWDDGVHDPYPDAELDHYRDAIRGLDRTYRYVAWLGDRPIGMLQHYLIDDHSDYARTLALGERAVGVDIFIGEADLIGRGHGPAMLRQFLRDVALPFHGTNVCVSDPRPATRVRSAPTRKPDSSACVRCAFPASPSRSFCCE